MASEDPTGTKNAGANLTAEQPATSQKGTGRPPSGPPGEGWSGWRLATFLYSILFLILLLALAFLYAAQPGNFQPLFKVEWVKDVFHAIWYAMLGGCPISLKGIYDHWVKKDWSGGRWELWYWGRPFSAAIVGAFTFVALQATNSSAPSIPALCIASFILGMQERRLFAFLSALASVVLSIPEDKTTALAISSVAPTQGAAGGTLLITGTGFTKSTEVQVGGQAVVKPQVNVDGTSIAGSVPAKAGDQAKVDVVAINPDGHAAAVSGGFTYSG